MIKFYCIIFGLCLLNYLIVIVSPREIRMVPSIVPTTGVLVIKKSGGIDDANEMVGIDLHTFKTSFEGKKLLDGDIKSIKDIYYDSTFKEFPNFTNVSIEDPQFYHYILSIEIPILPIPHKKVIIWQTYYNKPKPNFLGTLEYILYNYGVTLIY